MKTVIYLDVLLLLNFLVAYLLLRAVGFLCGAPPGFLRTCAGAVPAALSTLILLAPPMPAAACILYQTVSAAGICRAAFPFRGWRGFARQTVWYFLLNMGLAGAVLLALSRNLPLGVQTNNLAVYWAVSPTLLVGSAAGVYFVLRLVLALFGAPKDTENWELRLSLNGANAPPLNALLDTGFLLRDPLSGESPMLVSYNSLRGTLPPAISGFLEALFFRGLSGVSSRDTGTADSLQNRRGHAHTSRRGGIFCPAFRPGEPPSGRTGACGVHRPDSGRRFGAGTVRQRILSHHPAPARACPIGRTGKECC